MEIWADIQGYEGFYQVSNYGRVKSLCRQVKCKRWGFQTKPERIHDDKPHKNGYVYATLVKEGVNSCQRVHRLVAKAFLPNPGDHPEVNHKDGVKNNNLLSNLEWCSRSENALHKVRVLGKQVGANNSKAKLVLDNYTGVFYDTLREACTARELDYKKYSAIVSGARKGNTSLAYA